MDQVKIGLFLKELRKEKQLTQEEVGEIFNVSRRTVTRWETGYNMPDLSLLVEIADFYNVDLREIFEGERKEKKMNKDTKETIEMVAEYNAIENNKKRKIVLAYIIVGIICTIINQILVLSGVKDTFMAGFFKGLTATASLISLIIAALYLSGKLTKTPNHKSVLSNVKLRNVIIITIVLCLSGITVNVVGAILDLMYLAIIGMILIFVGVIYHISFYRCPHCGKYLDRSFSEYCPGCGKNINE